MEVTATFFHRPRARLGTGLLGGAEGVTVESRLDIKSCLADLGPNPLVSEVEKGPWEWYRLGYSCENP